MKETTIREQLYKEYSEKHPDTSDRGLAKILSTEHPEVFKTIEHARSYVRYIRGVNGEQKRKWANKHSTEFKSIEPNKEMVLRQIADMYTSSELQAIAHGGRLLPGYGKVPIISFTGDRIRIGAFGDTHIGSKYTPKDRILQAINEFKKEGCDIVVHTGDVTEGMSGRPGHIYELDQLGYNAQRKEAIEILSNWTKPMYLIDGNHDRWFIKSNGALMVKDIAEKLPDGHFLGHDEGDISLMGKAVLKLWHGEDGSSYAVSYRIQKVIESLSGGEKPSVMLFGHTHKSTYLFDRNVHCFSTGSMQSQSSWMRGKRIAAHTGFWIIDIYVNDSGVSKVTSTFYPFYT